MYHNWQSYNVWFLRYGAWWTEFFVILDQFLSFYSPPKNPKIKISKKLKRTLKISSFYTNVLKITTICYTVWQILYPFNFRQKIFFVILDHYLPFYLANNPKNQNLKKFEKSLEISSFTLMYHKSWSYSTLFLRSCVADVTHFLFCAIFYHFTPLTTQKTKI